MTKLDESSLQYVGYQSFFSRVTDFSLTQFASVYVQVGNNEQGYYEYNPLITLMKSSLFGVWTFISESNVGAVLPIILFWINVAIAGFAFVAMITLCLRKSLMQRTETLFLGGLYTVIMVSFYKMAADYPHTCTMDFRYITPTAIIGAVFTGLHLQRMNDQNKSFGRVVVFALDIGAFLFAVCSGLVYLICVK